MTSTMKNNGFTLIELMIVVAIIGIILAILIPGLKGAPYINNGTMCKGGYLFSVDGNGTHQQIINNQGTAIGCS